MLKISEFSLFRNATEDRVIGGVQDKIDRALKGANGEVVPGGFNPMEKLAADGILTNTEIIKYLTETRNELLADPSRRNLAMNQDELEAAIAALPDLLKQFSRTLDKESNIVIQIDGEVVAKTTAKHFSMPNRG